MLIDTDRLNDKQKGKLHNVVMDKLQVTVTPCQHVVMFVVMCSTYASVLHHYSTKVLFSKYCCGLRPFFRSSLNYSQPTGAGNAWECWNGHLEHGAKIGKNSDKAQAWAHGLGF